MAAVGLGFAGWLVQPLGRTPPASRPGPVLGAASPETTPTMRYACAIPSHTDYQQQHAQLNFSSNTTC